MRGRCGSILACAALAIIAAGGTLSSGKPSESDYREFTITAKDSGFEPSTLTVKKGEKVRLIITATDCEHEFRLQAFDILQALKRGDPEIIEFTASKSGTFEFKSSVYCGKGHGKMRGRLEVL